MGYESYVSGEVIPHDPVLLGTFFSARGFSIAHGEEIKDPGDSFTGMVWNDDEGLLGLEEWSTAYGFGALLQALQEASGKGLIISVEISREGEDKADEEYYLYDGRRWETIISLDAVVPLDQARQARDELQAALDGIVAAAFPEEGE